MPYGRCTRFRGSSINRGSYNFPTHKNLVREPAILLIKWLRPKGLKVCSYVKKSMLNSKIKLLKKSAGTQKCYAQQNTPG